MIFPFTAYLGWNKNIQSKYQITNSGAVNAMIIAGAMYATGTTTGANAAISSFAFIIFPFQYLLLSSVP